ncbi:hypothetical protein BP5796_09260 [Coleophoma crateriformis]|uniref:S-adenosyl-L-methionine-dependent methyltransferase n=1 Tax=Coleophoma crateriformis TaxID=565419 RepID=A0A3D8R3H5_9HELO|nr:hypothetical protein BP5796_09260 [Coleophoma crateriformis]
MASHQQDIPTVVDTPEVEDSPSIDTNSEPARDDDSAIDGMSNASSTASLQSSLYASVEENGRTYHRYKEGKYPLPNDAKEQERLEIQHELFRATLRGRLYLAPIESPKEVLDIATGTGVWAVEFANDHPESNVLGTDLSAIQPLYIPPNLRFEIDDAEDEWLFSNQFDYIHGRALVSCFTDPSVVLKSAFNALAPGGYLELQDGIFPMEYIGEPPVESNLYKWNQLLIEGSTKSGRPWTNVRHYKRWMQEIGFEEVVEKEFYWPTSQWPKGSYLKGVSNWWQKDFLQGLDGISMRIFTGMLGWSVEKVKEFTDEVRKDVVNKEIHAYLPIRVVYGRKPGNAP